MFGFRRTEQGLIRDNLHHASQSHEFWSGVGMYASKPSCLMDKEALSSLSSSKLATIESRFPELKTLPELRDQNNVG